MQATILQSVPKVARIVRDVKVRHVQPQPSAKVFPAEAYMTGKEFWEKVEKGVDEICQKYGVL